MAKTGRNDPCPCGSGKKYKKCCLFKSEKSVGIEDSIQSKLNQELLALFEKTYGQSGLEEALEEFWGEVQPELKDGLMGQAEVNFFEWIVHDWTDDIGMSLADLYMEKKKIISVDERGALEKISNSCLSLFEVIDVYPEEGLLLKDLLLDGEYRIKEKMATRYLNKWDILATRVLDVDGVYIMSGAAYVYPMERKSDILIDIKEEYEESYLAEKPEGTMKDFLKTVGDLFNFIWVDMIVNPQKITLTTLDGEMLIIAKAFYKVLDKEAAIKSLKKLKEMHERDNEYLWVSSEEVVLGAIRFADKKMVFECKSKERLKRGKSLIAKKVVGVNHKIDTYEDINKHIESLKDKPEEGKPNEFPFEVEQELYNQFMEKHYRKWLKDKIPALEGKTPKQAMRSKKGKEQVRDLLKSIENNEEQNRREARPVYDVSWLWEELGLDRD